MKSKLKDMNMKKIKIKFICSDIVVAFRTLLCCFYVLYSLALFSFDHFSPFMHFASFILQNPNFVVLEN